MQSAGSGYESAVSCSEHANEYQDSGNVGYFLLAENPLVSQE